MVVIYFVLEDRVELKSEALVGENSVDTKLLTVSLELFEVMQKRALMFLP